VQKDFLKYLLNKPDAYLVVWSWMFANSDDDGVYTCTPSSLLSRFKITRSTLQRIIDYGVSWAESGQKVGSKLGRKWADNELKVTFPIGFSGRKVGGKMGRKWAESGQLTNEEPVKKTIEEPTLETPQDPKTSKKEKPKSEKLYPNMLEVYDEFCLNKTGMGAKMNAHQGKSMKSIMEYLANQIKIKRGNEVSEEILKEEILLAWKYILSNWSKINGYYAEQIKLSQIDSNLPNLLIQLRNKKTNGREQKFANTESEIGKIDFDETQPD
jgi:hypothetical protein